MELMIVIGIIGLTLAASIPNMQSLLRQKRLNAATQELVTHLRLARAKSVSEGNNFIVTFRVNENTFQIWDDESNDAIVGPDDARRDFEMPHGAVVQAATFFGANRVIFRPDGTSDASGFVRIGNGENVRLVNVLASTGKVTVTTP
jgi:Tfp pilus assembly protein FimT